MLSSQYESDSAPFAACIAAEALSNQLAELAGADLFQVCIVFSPGKSVFYFDGDDAVGVGKTVVRAAQKQPAYARKIAKEFNEHAQAHEAFIKSIPGFSQKDKDSKALSAHISKFSQERAVLEAYLALCGFSIPALSANSRACLEAHLKKKGRDEAVSLMLSGKQKKKGTPSQQAEGSAAEQAAAQAQPLPPEQEIPQICAPLIDALHSLQKIQTRASALRTDSFAAASPLLAAASAALKLKGNEITWLSAGEISQALLSGGETRHVVRERGKGCVYSHKEGFGSFYIGENAKVYAREVIGQ
ncbi:MAG: hypothetical protein V1708_06010 [Candidatus Micrarchaeota archaeon]